MSDFIIYPASRRFYRQIVKGRRDDYVLTTRVPEGLEVDFRPPNVDYGGLFRRLFVKKWPPVICIGPTSRAKFLLAVRSDLAE